MKSKSNPRPVWCVTAERLDSIFGGRRTDIFFEPLSKRFSNFSASFQAKHSFMYLANMLLALQRR